MLVKRVMVGIGLAVLACMGAVSVFTGSLRARSRAESSWGFADSNLDKSCKPCDDFYQFAMGGWMKANPIPAEYATWGTFTELRDMNLTAMRTILDAASKGERISGGTTKRGAGSSASEANEKKIGDYYASCMDTAAIEAAGLKPIAGEFATIDAIGDRKSLDAAIAKLQREGVGVVFRFGSGQDIKDSTRVIANAGQGGLGMPDRDYYLRDDDKLKQLRVDYEQHVTKMLELAGDDADKAAAEAKTVVAIETELA